MESQTLYRRWRPQTFSQVVGQEPVTRTLLNALRRGLLAHAYLFCGPRGTGKTSTARILAKAANCLSNSGRDEPCDQCAMCGAIREGHALDVIEIDAASNRGIDDIRDLREKVKLSPTEAQYKFYIIDEAHQLTEPAFNALLKTLEEPPPRTIFVLASTDVHRIPATILSRCQRFDFRPIRVAPLKEHLQHICLRENIAIEPAALEHLARAARGSLRDAESVLDQLRLYSQGEITMVDVQTLLGTAGIEAALELVRCLAQRDLAEGLRLIDRLVKDGVDMERLGQAVVEELRGLLLLRAGEPALLERSGDELAEREALARQLTVPAILQAIERFNVAARETHAHAHPQLPLELALLGSMPQSQKANQEANDPIPSPEPFSGDDPPKNVSAEARLPLVKAGEDDGSAELYELKSRWPQVLELLGRNEAAGLLRSCQPVSVEDSVVTLGFYHTFHLERAEEPQKRALVADMISRVLGRPYRLKLIHKPKARPVEHPLVQEALRMGGRIKKISTDESPTNEEAV